MVRAVVLKFNSRLALKPVHEITTWTLTTCRTIMQNPWVQNKVQQIIRATVFIFRLFCVVSSIEVNSTWIFFWISKRLISLAWDLLAFNVNNICISTIYDGIRLLILTVSTCTRMFVLWVKSKVFYIQFKKLVSIHFRMTYLKGSIIKVEA